MTGPRFSIGIDLGTTNSVLAFVPLAEDAASQVLPVAQWESASALIERATLPSFLYLPDEPVAERMRGRAVGSGGWIVGQFARDSARDAPGRVAQSAKSWLSHHGADREAAMLPWGSQDVPAEMKISPVHASALILSYFRGAWNDRFAEHGPAWAFDAQDVTVTVPASFDAVAQRLTLMAARQAGFPDTVRLLEEPQAAFYTWLERYGGESRAWAELAGGGAGGGAAQDARHVLVVDIGGGTSDFSLFAVRPAAGAGAHINRLAVSEHILLGGDNIDLALAHALESRLDDGGTAISGDRWDYLVARCRDLKERALSVEGPADEEFHISVSGRGSGLVAAARSARISRADIERILLDGFFPACNADAAPRRPAAALKEWGLPYATDSAITRHLADFLRGRPSPDAVLFNGGALYPEPLRRRIGEQIGRWNKGPAPLALNNDQPDLAVARGAARFGKLVRVGKQRIEAGAARAIFLEAQSGAKPAGKHAGGPTLICVLPRNAAPEKTFEVADLVMDLRINRPVRFQAYSSTRHGDVEAGDIVSADTTELHSLPPLETLARVEQPASGETGRTIPVTLSARLSELGLLHIRCHSTGTAERLSWPLEFNLRAHAQPDGAAIVSGAASADGAAVAAPAGPNAAPDAIAAAGEVIARIFSRQYAGRDKLTAARVLQSLERPLKLAKGEWNWVLIRSLWPSLETCAGERARSLEHEETWLMLAGYLLRPGFGAAGDDGRIDSLWRLNEPGLRSANKRVMVQAYILWRRVAGGLSRERQRAVIAGDLDKIRRQANPPPELIRMSGALERIDHASKSELAGLYIERAAELARSGRHCAPYLAALGLLLNRAPLYAGPEDVVAPALVERAFEAFAKLDWTHAELAEMPILFLRAARVVGDRGLDVNKSLRLRIAGKLEKLGVSASRTARLRAHVPMAAAERGGLFGEALPPGLILHERQDIS